MIKIPVVGVLVYGIAEASTAYLLTKITDPPPPRDDKKEKAAYIESQVRWKNKNKFLSLDIFDLDALDVKKKTDKEHDHHHHSKERHTPSKKFS